MERAIVVVQVDGSDADPSIWILTSSVSGPSPRDIPWRVDPTFLQRLQRFWSQAEKPLDNDTRRQALETDAIALGDAVADLLHPLDRDYLMARSRGGLAVCLLIEAKTEVPLILPWELLRFDGRFAARDGRIDVVRTIVADGARSLHPPSESLRLSINILSSRDARADYEAAAYRVRRALQEQASITINGLGSLSSLVSAVATERPHGVHIVGAFDPGKIFFNVDSGSPLQLPVMAFVDTLRANGITVLPDLFFLAGGLSSRIPAYPEPFPTSCEWSIAAYLHREGAPEVIAFNGDLPDDLCADAAESFYRGVAHGLPTCDAIRAARRTLVSSPDSTLHAQTKVSAFPFAWAYLTLFHRGPHYPISHPLPMRFIFEGTVYPERAETGFLPGGQEFVGRRSELLSLNGLRESGRRVIVLHGLGGIGKSAICYELLKYEERDGIRIINLACAGLQDHDNPTDALLDQYLTLAQGYSNARWPEIQAAADSALVRLNATRSSVARFVSLVRVALANEGPMTFYVDNLESLFHVSHNDELVGPVRWRDGHCADLWRRLVAIAKGTRGQFRLIASTRYRHVELEEHTIPLPPMNNEDLFRLTGWYPALRRLCLKNRHRLVALLHGSPRALDLLAPLVHQATVAWETKQTLGFPRHAENPRTDQASEEWAHVIEAALPKLAGQLREDMLFDKLWDHILGSVAQELLVRATVVQRPESWRLMLALAGQGVPEEVAETALHLLRACALIVEWRGHSRSSKFSLFDVHPSVRFFARRRAGTRTGPLLVEAHTIIATFRASGVAT